MKLEHISKIAVKAGIQEEFLEYYGNSKAKIDLSIMDTLKNKKDGKLVLVTAITPTKAGEGKTTTSIGLQDGLRKIGVNSMLALREPSLGPVFGLKGGATGGGKETVEPQEDINLHFTGDMHALTSSINLISAVIENHIFQGNELGIDPNNIIWKRALDMNDRSLRSIVVNEDDKKAIPHKSEFVITVASELMAIMCLAKDTEDFKKKVSNIIVAYTFDGKPVYLYELKITNAIMKLMKEALKPNLVQTSENNPALIHGGPFANIAHGCNSIIALQLASKLGDVVVTEAGFGADLGAEKFLDICCPNAGLKPEAVVLVATIRALKLHGGVAFEELDIENVAALENGVGNLKVHYENVCKYGLPCIIAINKFASDTDNEVNWLISWCKTNNIQYSFVDSFSKGSDGSVDLAQKVMKVLEGESNYKPLYDVEKETIVEKIEKIAKQIYRADNVVYSDKAKEKLELLKDKQNYFVCVAKTPLSLSDNAKNIGVPTGFSINIKDISLSNGAKFIVPLTGAIMTMPGLPKVPAAVKMEEE